MDWVLSIAHRTGLGYVSYFLRDWLRIEYMRSHFIVIGSLQGKVQVTPASPGWISTSCALPDSTISRAMQW
jgi:hypothetical protein